MSIPTIKLATSILEEAGRMNPGEWIGHSMTAASTARSIAGQCPDLNEDRAYVFGLLHDIGRREGFSHIAHIIKGYNYLLNLGYDEAAAICLTHSFPLKNVITYFGEIDVTGDELKFISSFISNRIYDDYDKLIQLCDALSLPNGAVLMEKRLVDVVMRHGLPDWTLDKWRAYMELKEYFDSLTRQNIYALIPGIVENTFNYSE